MSAAEQKRFLTKLHNELQRDSEEYRKMTADRRMHTFTLARGKIRKGIKDRLEKDFSDISKGAVKSILAKSDKHVRKLIRETGRAIVALKQKEPDDITILKFTPSVVRAAFSATGGSRFDQIKRTYNTNYKATAEGISDAIKEVLGEEKGKDLEASSMWQLEHNYLKGIAESQIKDAIDNALLEEERITMASAMAFFKGMGVELDVIRDGSTGVMEVFLGSQRANAREGGISGAKKKKLEKALLEGLQILSNGGILENLGGSDSFKESKIKKTRRRTLKPFNRLKNVKVTSKDIEADDSRTDTKKSVVRNTRIAKNAMKRKAVRQARGKKAGIAAQPLQLIGLINQELPNTVKKNMKEPALVNRSGRFAESVRLTEVIQTPQGFPSFGYTYQRNPYQVFEEGSSGNWSNGQRDPRVLIDKSIREIAAHFALGRFYTRRV